MTFDPKKNINKRTVDLEKYWNTWLNSWVGIVFSQRMCRTNLVPWRCPRGWTWEFCSASVRNCRSECWDTWLSRHWLGNSKIVIAKLVNRQDTIKILWNKKKLRELLCSGKQKLGTEKIYVNESLCSQRVIEKETNWIFSYN